MTSSLSNLVDNLSEEIHKIKCLYGHDNKKCETCGTKYRDFEGCLEYTNAKDNLILHKCCSKNYQKKFQQNLKERFANTYNFFTRDINKFILFLPKGVYPYDYMDDWENSVKYHYLKKKIFVVT